jgi:hypothetical protein
MTEAREEKLIDRQGNHSPESQDLTEAGGDLRSEASISESLDSPRS